MKIDYIKVDFYGIPEKKILTVFINRGYNQGYGSQGYKNGYKNYGYNKNARQHQPPSRKRSKASPAEEGARRIKKTAE